MTPIHFWALPYPGQWTLNECLEIATDAGFEGIEVNIDLEGELSVRSNPAQLVELGRLAHRSILGQTGPLRVWLTRVETPGSILDRDFVYVQRERSACNCEVRQWLSMLASHLGSLGWRLALPEKKEN